LNFKGELRHVYSPGDGDFDMSLIFGEQSGPSCVEFEPKCKC